MKPQKKEAARDLRRHGKSINYIAKELEVSKGSVSVWVRDIKLSQEQQTALDLQNPARQLPSANRAKIGQKNSNTWRKRRLAFQEEGRLRANEIPLQQVAMLYWGEGSKHKNTFRIVNTNPHLLRLCKDHVEDIFQGPFPWEFNVGLHNTHQMPLQIIEEFWLKVLGLPQSSLRNANIDPRDHTGRRNKKHHPYGSGHIRLNRTDIVQTIYGAIQEIGKFNEPRWLG